MHFTIDRSQFLKALSHGQSVVEKRTAVPILGNVLLHAQDGKLHLTTTDMDIALIESVDAEVVTGGITTVSAQMIFDIIRKMPEGSRIEISYSIEQEHLFIKTNRSRFQLPCLNAEDFPKLNHGELPHHFKINGSVLRRLIDKARFAMSIEETRYFLNGIHFHPHQKDGQLVLRSIATDAHRLACIEAPLPSGAEQMPGIIVGRKTVNEVRKLLEESDTDITIGLSSNRIEFALHNAILTSRLIDGTYPDYEKAIPLHNDKKVIVNLKEFASAVDRVATVANDKAHVIKCDFRPEQLELSAIGQDAGAANEEMSIDYQGTGSVQIGFNAKYLLDITQQIDEEEAEILLFDGNAPAIIKGTKDHQSMFVLMPMRV